MSDELAERIKAVEQEHRERKRVEIELKNSGDRINEFISGHAREEYEKLKHLLKERAEKMNAVRGRKTNATAPVLDSTARSGHQQLAAKRVAN